jgi:malonyl-CoA O-methyltransferase
MSVDKSSVERRFGRHAATYERHARVQAEMAERLIARLNEFDRAPRAILELGCGTGVLTELLVTSFPDAKITAVDIAPGMVDACASRFSGVGRVEVLLGDAEERRWGQRRFDFVVSNATLQWFDRPEATMDSIVDSLTPDGATLHATFGPRTFEELFTTLAQIDHERGDAPTRRGLEMLSADDRGSILRASGAVDVVTHSRLRVVEYRSCRTFLSAMREMGVSTGRGAGSSAARLAEVARRYDREYRSGGGVRATFEVVEFEGRRPGSGALR